MVATHEESWGIKVARIAADIVAQHKHLELGIVTDYDADTHRVQVQIQPDGDVVTVQMGTPHVGLSHPIRPGVLCLVGYVGNEPQGVVCVLHSESAADTPPGVAHAIEGDLYVNGAATLTGGVTLPPSLVLPTPTAADRGTVRVLGTAALGIAGAADVLVWCGQKADGTLIWKTIATAV